MTSDRERWETKYAGRPIDTGIHADALLTAYASRLPADGYALDVAAGTCDNACFLAQRGYDAFAVDISHSGLVLCLAKARANGLHVFPFVADLTSYPLPIDCFAVVTVTRYLERELLPRLRASVRPGGWVFYRTFNRRHLREHPGFPDQYVLREGELQDAFAGWETVTTNENSAGEDTTSYWVGCKPAMRT